MNCGFKWAPDLRVKYLNRQMHNDGVLQSHWSSAQGEELRTEMG